jgi:hypothetical protein
MTRRDYAKENRKLRECLKIVHSKVGSIVDNLTNKNDESEADLEKLGKQILDLGNFCKKFKFSK